MVSRRILAYISYYLIPLDLLDVNLELRHFSLLLKSVSASVGGVIVAGPYCASYYKPPRYVSSESSASVCFHSDEYASEEGFHLDYTCSAPCGGVFSDSLGVITSPGWPNKYPNNHNCCWNITCEEEKAIHLSFLEFETKG